MSTTVCDCVAPGQGSTSISRLGSVTWMVSHLDTQANPFYAALGRAFAKWQNVEAALYMMAHVSLGTEPRTTSIVYFHVRSQDSKIKLVDKLCRENLRPELLRFWTDDFHKRLEDSCAVRNRFAHFETASVLDPSAYDGADPPLILVPHHMDYGTLERKTVQFYHTAEILEHGSRWATLANDMFTFVVSHFEANDLHMHLLPPVVARGISNMRDMLQDASRRPAATTPEG
jgi:hypothetical protein